MRAVVLLVCLWAGGLAQTPQPCSSPPLMTGSLSVSSQNEKVGGFAKYEYDGVGQRLRLRDFQPYDNKTFHLDVLLLYKEGVMYKLNYKNQTCSKNRLNREFRPLAVPKDATLLGPAILGSSSDGGPGLLVHSWVGELQMTNRTAKYMITVTGVGCVPITTLLHTSKYGWTTTNFFDNVMGLTDPQQLIPPTFCKDAVLQGEEGQDPVTLYSLF